VVSTTTRDASGRSISLHISVNGETRVIPTACTVNDLLVRLALESKRIAVAINRDVVPRSEFASHRLTAGDRVEILEAVGGGC
jgi:sulfur carrier protein